MIPKNYPCKNKIIYLVTYFINKCLKFLIRFFNDKIIIVIKLLKYDKHSFKYNQILLKANIFEASTDIFFEEAI